MMISILKLFGGWAPVAGALLSGLISPASYADEKIHESGKLYFYGALFSSTCSLSDEAKVVGIDMGAVDAAGLKAIGSVSPPVQFRLDFNNCLLGASSMVSTAQDKPLYITGEQAIRLRFLGESDADSPHLLKLHGGTRGVGLKIWDRENRVVNFARPSRDYMLHQGDNTLWFNAALEATGPDMLANKFEGVAYVQIIYL